MENAFSKLHLQEKYKATCSTTRKKQLFGLLQNSHERPSRNRPLQLPLFSRSGSTTAGYRPPVRDPAGGRN